MMPASLVPRPARRAASTYAPSRPLLPHEVAVIDAARAILTARLRSPGVMFDSPRSVRDLLTLQLGDLRSWWRAPRVQRQRATERLHVRFDIALQAHEHQHDGCQDAERDDGERPA